MTGGAAGAPSAPGAPGAPGALRRVIGRARAGDDGGAARARCELCAAAVPERHRHLLDEQRGDLLCVCRACALLFDRDAAGRGHYRLVPDVRTRVPELSPGELGVPVGLAFFVARADGTVLAHCPSPVGPTRWEVDGDAWREAQRRHPPLRHLAPGVQALLVNTARGSREHWIVPVDDCYRLVALVRAHWQGLSGGSRVWPAVADFFAGLDRDAGGRARPAPA